MKSHRAGWRPLVAVCAVVSGTAAADDSLQEIVVTASLRGSNAADLPQSVTVLDAATLQAAGVQHFEDVLAMVPNLSWASGSSRPRFFQMRGIGEVEQYQGAPTLRSASLSTISTSPASACRRRCSIPRKSKCCAARRARCTVPTRWPA